MDNPKFFKLDNQPKSPDDKALFSVFLTGNGGVNVNTELSKLQISKIQEDDELIISIVAANRSDSVVVSESVVIKALPRNGKTTILISDLGSLSLGDQAAQLTLSRKLEDASDGEFLVVDFPDLFIFTLGTSDMSDDIQLVKLTPASPPPTEEADLWTRILNTDVDFNKFRKFMDEVLLGETDKQSKDVLPNRNSAKRRLPFTNVDEYSLAKFATEAFVAHFLHIDKANGYFGGSLPLPYYTHLSESLEEILGDYDLNKLPSQPMVAQAARFVQQGESKTPKPTDNITRVIERVEHLPNLELIWSYWMEQAMLVQTMGIVNLRFQNIKGVREVEPLLRFDTSPLRPLNNLLWGHIQDEQHRTTLSRRFFEYQHAYDLNLVGKAVPAMRGLDNRSQFLEAFHNLLHQATLFFKDFDDMTRRADGFPLLTALREVHLLLAEGNHNAYYNMTLTTRVEFMTMQYILSRPEMRMFLGGRPMVPYPEQWMDRVDTMKQVQGWDQTSVLHYYDLATSGEKLLLGIRYGDWTVASFSAEHAVTWATSFRNHAMRYINAYRIVTGVDLSSDTIKIVPEERALQPSSLIQRRLQGAQEPMRVQATNRVVIRRSGGQSGR